MKPILMAALVASLAATSGSLVLMPSLNGSSILFECEDIVEGDRVEFGQREVDMGVERMLEGRAEADSRVRVEVRSEIRDGDSQERREVQGIPGAVGPVGAVGGRDRVRGRHGRERVRHPDRLRARVQDDGARLGQFDAGSLDFGGTVARSVREFRD